MALTSILKQCPNIFQRKKFVKSMRQVPCLGGLICRSKFESQHKNREVKNCGKNCVNFPYLLKASLYQFKQVNKTFFLKNSFNSESSNLTYLIFCKGKYVGETGWPVKEQIKIYRQDLLFLFIEHSVGSNSNNAWTPPLAVHSQHVTTKPLCWWGGWVHWIVFMISLYMYYILSFVLIEHSVHHEPIFVLINVFTLLA